MKENVHPLDIVFRLAEDHAIVLLNGGGFDAPDWSARVSFANLPDEAYEKIGRAVRGGSARLRPSLARERGKADQRIGLTGLCFRISASSSRLRRRMPDRSCPARPA